MPGLVRKLLIFAAIDGLILQPTAQKGQRPAPATKITYKDKHVGPASYDSHDAEGSSAKGFEAFGIVGLLTVSKSSFLISITKREQVAQIQGKPIYVITEVALTPLASRIEAENSINNTRAGLLKSSIEGHGLDDSDSEDDEVNVSDEVEDDTATESHTRTSSVAEDVISKKGGYGRFAQKWFSKKGWAVDQKRNLGMSAEPYATREQDARSVDVAAAISKDAEVEPEVLISDKVRDIEDVGKSDKVKNVQDIAESMLPKLLRTTQILFGTSRSYYFSYDHDITRSLANKRNTNSELPLHKEVDPLFFWNRHLLLPFINAGQASFALPLMQGFVGQRAFVMDSNPPKPVVNSDTERTSMELNEITTDSSDEQISTARVSTDKPYLLTLVSRRSVKRAGLRYLRRGVDEDGNTANGVETEQILSDSTWAPSSKIHSFVQIRGSIPLFFSQSPYSFKPVPQVHHSTETNYEAFKKHFDNITDRYGAIQVASLVEKHGPEAILGGEYEKLMTLLNVSRAGEHKKSIGFEWFDFHAICKGMKFQNVSLLMDILGEKLDSFSDTSEVDGKLVSKQTGVLRTNCMDCLDRTNVVQSAVAKRALEMQLKDEGLDITLQVDQTQQWFNTLWADNGDAISKQYASTAALKGDFTRTRKRDYKGALTDMGLSISRFYSGIVNDYFSQAAIDFLLGNVSYLVFEDFEANMMSGDPGISMQKMRQQAIDVSQKLVVADDGEEFIGGWTFLTPQVPNTIKSSPFEESVLLLTDAALYMCHFDWNIEKVSSFVRVGLNQVVGLKFGTYITSTLSQAQADEKRNVGIVVTYRAGSNEIIRVNTRSMATEFPSSKLSLEDKTSTTASASSTNSVVAPIAAGFANLISGLQNQTAPEPKDAMKVLAFKALPSRSAVSNEGVSEFEQVKSVCSEIRRMVETATLREAGGERQNIVEEGTIISLAEAKKNTGLFDMLGHQVKKLVWA
ncbi:a3974e41-2187-40ef-af42-202d25ba5055 [Sclerotinia trifoliorum]|uniref:A3974e41-2187-40ef-af42-202d25ba5055 n=1 Tax=Sclerotinia trifoliorum TaxID=28548 RepID=A0A8H2ZMQ6_9HELO|nr:a3974e41-2187-40ef-af42-202d25ba5055 [Sclerotinia trifoliorum]